MRIAFRHPSHPLAFGGTGVTSAATEATPPEPQGGVLRLMLPQGSQSWYYAYPIRLQPNQAQRLARIYPGRSFTEKLIYVALPITQAGQYDSERLPKILTSQSSVKGLDELPKYNPPVRGQDPLVRQMAVALFTEADANDPLRLVRIGDTAHDVWYRFYNRNAIS